MRVGNKENLMDLNRTYEVTFLSNLYACNLRCPFMITTNSACYWPTFRWRGGGVETI
jgi:hypothetical protein